MVVWACLVGWSQLPFDFGGLLVAFASDLVLVSEFGSLFDPLFVWLDDGSYFAARKDASLSSSMVQLW
ncbi:hypothetical protein U1Q18_039141, partial [Sarracenia purpurea var. burkii]